MLLHEVLADAARRVPDEIALVTDAGAPTFAQLSGQVERVAGGIAAITEPGDRVAILAENRAEYVECYYAVPRAGRLLVPLNHRLHRQEWIATLTRSGARVLIAEPELLDRLGADAARAAGVETIVGLDGAVSDRAYNDLMRSAGRSGHEVRRPERPEAQPERLGDIAWLIGTSGTTGSPKLAMLTHRSLLAAADATLGARPVGDDDTLLTPFPLCHVAGYNVLVFHRRARPIVLMRRFDPVRLLELVAEHGVTMLSLAPTMIAMLLDDPRTDDEVLASVRAIGYGASSIPAPVLRAAVDRWGCDLSQGYGMTELSGNAVFLGADEHRAAAAGDDRLLAAAGYPAPGVELSLDQANGEVLVRAPQVMAGYWQAPEASAAALAGGWLHTGDAGRIDADGLLTIVDRTKDIVVTGGENVASREVEAVLHTHPDVADVAVIGLADERWGERVAAVVVRRDGATVRADELVALARSQLAGFKTPRTVVFVDALPHNAAGKVLKQQLRDELGSPAPDPGTAVE
jgi:acyl-CoA synthetase (AMP-forming)/AMP-acid ligase II